MSLVCVAQIHLGVAAEQTMQSPLHDASKPSVEMETDSTRIPTALSVVAV